MSSVGSRATRRCLPEKLGKGQRLEGGVPGGRVLAEDEIIEHRHRQVHYR